MLFKPPNSDAEKRRRDWSEAGNRDKVEKQRENEIRKREEAETRAGNARGDPQADGCDVKRMTPESSSRLRMVKGVDTSE